MPILSGETSTTQLSQSRDGGTRLSVQSREVRIYCNSNLINILNICSSTAARTVHQYAMTILG
jgi:hypothetical protein